MLESKPSNRYLSVFCLSFSNCLRSNMWKPVKYIVSESSKVLMYLSMGEELDREGDTLTSSSHGLNF